MNSSARRLVPFLFVMTLLASAAVRAEDGGRRVIPVGWADLYAGNMVDFRTLFSVGDHYTGYIPELSVQFGNGSLAAGLDFGLSIADVDGVDTDVFPGSFVANFKARKCLEGNWRVCFGTEFEFSVAPFEVDDDGEASSLTIGLMTKQMRWSRYFAESIIIDPLLAASFSHDILYFQISLGPSMIFPYTDNYGGDTTEVALLYSFEGGLVVNDLIGAGFGFKGLSTVSFDDNETFFSLDFGLRLILDGVTPCFGINVPLSGDLYEDIIDVVISLGVVAEL